MGGDTATTYTHMVVHDYICRIDEYSDRLPDCESPPVANAI